MCSRYELTGPHSRVNQRFHLIEPLPGLNAAEVRPTDMAAVIAPDRRPRLMRWGLEVAWDKRPLINARSESLESKPTFRRLLGRRVLVPATAWFEWRKEGKLRHKNRIARPDGEPFALAGLEDGERFTIVTCPACPALVHVHDRMPAVLPPDGEAAWLDATLPWREVAELLGPCDQVTAVEEPKETPGLFD